MPREEFRKFLITTGIVSMIASTVLGVTIWAGWVAPVWIFVAPLALYIGIVSYSLVRTIQIVREERKQSRLKPPSARTT